MYIRRLILALVALLASAAASAGTDSARMEVSVRVVPNCRIAVTDLAFGAYDPLIEHASRNLDGTALVRVVCTRNERATILMEDQGSSQRALRFGSHQIAYSLFMDPARTQTWGSGVNVVQISFPEGAKPKEFTVYGRIPAGQVVPAGSYHDSVIATVDF